MVYNKTSINYYVEIMFLRKLLRQLLRPSFMPKLIARVTGLDRAKLERHRELLRAKARLTKQEWLNLNTDGPDCPLSGVYTEAEARKLFVAFEAVRTEVWFFDRTHWPFIGRVMPRRLEECSGVTWAGIAWCTPESQPEASGATTLREPHNAHGSPPGCLRRRDVKEQTSACERARVNS